MASIQQILNKYRGVSTHPAASCPPAQAPPVKPASTAHRPAERVDLSGRKIHIDIDARAWIDLSAIPEAAAKEMQSAFTVPNPDYKKAKRYGNRLTPPDPFLHAFEISDDNRLAFPRASLRWLIDYLQSHGAAVELNDMTVSARLDEEINLNDTQSWPSSASVLFEKRFGIYVGDGDGRRRFAAHIISQRGERTLVVVKRKPQLYQFRDALCRYTSLQQDQIGLVGDGKMIIDKPVIIAIDRSLWKCISNLPPIGQVIIARADQVNMKIFYRVAWGLPARYLLGLAAMDHRSDGLTRMMVAFCGPVRYRHQQPAVLPEFMPRVDVLKTTGDYTGNNEYDPAVTQLLEDDERTRRIAGDILSLAASGNQVVVVSSRVDHLEKIRGLLSDQYKEARVVFGRTTKTQLDDILAAFNNKNIQILLTTTKTVGALKIDTRAQLVAVVAAPFKYRDTATSIVHLLRSGGPGRDPDRLIEYSDNSRFFTAALGYRLNTYKQLGLKVISG